MYPDVDSTVYVYAPAGNDLKYHLDRINGYNARAEDPTHWDEKIYSGEDFFEKMIAEKKGNVVVLSGNNKKKSEYIVSSLQ
ncbi:MAG: oxidoreductase, partial [Chitinophagaceae bacterium]|nr:oxidoreductase [Chitinophagaceae bacterium]